MNDEVSDKTPFNSLISRQCWAELWLTGLQFRDAEEILQGSSEDEMFEAPLTKTYDAISADGGDLLFPATAAESLKDTHPSPVHIFRLWQTYLDNVDPLVKLFHAPTVQHRILEASSDLANISKGIEALMFGIYALAVTSLADEDCKTMFGEEKSILLSRYRSSAQQALLRAGFLRSSDMVVLQAYVLFLVSSFSSLRKSLFLFFCLQFHVLVLIKLFAVLESPFLY